MSDQNPDKPPEFDPTELPPLPQGPFPTESSTPPDSVPPQQAQEGQKQAGQGGAYEPDSELMSSLHNIESSLQQLLQLWQGILNS